MGMCLTKADGLLDSGTPISKKTVDEEREMHCNEAEQIDIVQGKKASLRDFEFIRVIGRGGYGKVMLISHKQSSKLYAMKILRKDMVAQTNSRIYTQNERDILATVDHPFLVKLHYAFQTKQKLYFIIDFMIGGELFFHLRRAGKLSEEFAKFYCAEILLAIEHLHSKDIIYRDLKPENVLLDSDGHIRLTDFGLCKTDIKEGDFATTLCGTYDYMAPEVYLQKGHNRSADWYSFGTILYVMLCGLPPFYQLNKRQMMRDRLDKEIEMKEWFSFEAKDILSSLLKNRPKDRLGFEGAHEIKQHPFFSCIVWEQLINKQITAPFKPKLLNDKDLRNFDVEPIKDTPVDGKLQEDYYDRFTFMKSSQGKDMFMELNPSFSLNLSGLK